MTQESNSAIQKQLSQPGNPFKRYQQSATGDYGVWHLILYELVNLTCLSLPGRSGSLIRRWGLSLVSAHIGKQVQIGVNNFCLHPKKLWIEDQVKTGNDATFSTKNTGDGITLREQVQIGERTILNCAGGKITVGRQTKIENDCRLGSLKGLTVGEHCSIGQYTCIAGAGHAISDLTRPIIEQPLVSKGHTRIEDYVEIGEKVTILDGVCVGHNVKIAANSLVNKDIPPNTCVAGIPAKICSQQEG